MFKRRIEEELKKVVNDLGYEEVDIVCDIPKNKSFGDYTSNIPLQLANLKSDKVKQTAPEIAKQISEKMETPEYLEKVEAVGGFINFYLKPNALMENLNQVCDYSSLVNPEVELENDKQKILLEYASFNALKPVHVGHMRNIVLGEAISRLLESQGNKVFRADYASDIGLPSAKVVWALQQDLEGFKQAKKKPLKEKMDFLGEVYVKGNSAYESDENAKEEISHINKKIYQRDPEITKIWQEALKWTFEYFQFIYDLVDSRFDKEFLESEVEARGAEIVRENIGKVFREDQGAVIFPGEEFGLHNRVFISSVGNPTYEAKDMALAEEEYKAFPFDRAIHVVANDQDEYFKVIFKALEQLDPDLARKEEHLSYGYVFLESGKKMSSRYGNVVTLEDVYEQIKSRIEKIVQKSEVLSENEKIEIIKIVSIGAMKFSILRYAPRTDITFDLEKSVSLQGDSGPYVQYSYARAKSVLRNAKFDYQVELPHSEKHPDTIEHELEKEERDLLSHIEHFDILVSSATENLSPNLLAEYLLDLSKIFNLFYQKHPIIKGEQTEFRLALTCAVAVILKQGLNLLGIESPERM